MNQNEMDRVGYFLDALQAALLMDSGWYCWTNRPDIGLVIEHKDQRITLLSDGTWRAEGIEGVLPQSLEYVFPPRAPARHAQFDVAPVEVIPHRNAG